MGLQNVIDHLVCPHDQSPLWLAEHVVGCSQGHRFDVARQGYLNLLLGPAPAAADTAGMVDARMRVQADGLLDPLTDALVAAAATAAVEGPVIDVGAGTGHHLAAVLEATGAPAGIAVDLSKYAARRAAKAHPRIGAVVADIWVGLPLRDACAGVVLNVFAPRSPEEFARVLAPAGLLVVVTPEPDHLEPLVEVLGLLRPQADKTAQIDAAVAPAFELTGRERVRWAQHLDVDQVGALVASGPSAHHLDSAEVRRVAAERVDQEVRFTVTVSVYRRRPESA